MTTELEADTARIAALWRGQAEFGRRVPRSSNQAGSIEGESGGYFVAPEGLNGRRAYLKPTRKNDVRRAAREKLAFDLAHDLGVNVPPANLAISEVGGKHERFVSISLVMYPHQFAWGELKDQLKKETELARTLRALLPKACARALAFDTWLDQTDHNDHPANIQFGYVQPDYSKGRFIFLDYAFAMGALGGWESEGWKKCTAAPFPPLMLEAVDRAELAAAIGDIEAVSDRVVTDLIDRIPWQYLRDEEKPLMKDGLLGRRGMVRAALAGYLGETDATDV